MIAVILLAAPCQARAQRLERVLNRASDYVQQFERDFAMVISDETYEQDDHRAHRARELQSEMAFLWLPREQTWLAVRNVLAVTEAGKTRRIHDGDTRLARVLNSSSIGQVRRLADEGARFNLGRIKRNVNDPTLVLRFLDETYRSRFDFQLAEPEERVNGVDAWMLTFTERQRPTVIGTDADVFSTGALWVSRVDGTVLRTRLTIAPGQPTASLTVDYGRDPKLGMWVPARMEEIYTELPHESITCVARYTNFRRFETSGRVLE